MLVSSALGHIRQVCTSRPFWEKDEKTTAALRGNAIAGDMSAVFSDDNLNTDHWRNLPEEIGPGFFAEVGTHAVDTMLWLAGGHNRERGGSNAGCCVYCGDYRSRTESCPRPRMYGPCYPDRSNIPCCTGTAHNQIVAGLCPDCARTVLLFRPTKLTKLV